MAGRNTSKEEHESRVGNIVDEYFLPETIRHSLSVILGKHIDNEKKYFIEDLISNYRYMMRLPADVKTQDIKRTLMAMCKLSEEEALVAYKNCDIYTEGHILRQLYFIKKEGRIPFILEAITRALARENRIIQIGGQPNKKIIVEFVIDCLFAWSRWTIKPITCSHDDTVRIIKDYDSFGIPSETLEWCHILLQQVLGYGYDYRKLAKYISQNRGKVLSP